MAVSLATLRTRARERADMVGSSFIADSATGIDAYINEGAQKLHELLVQTYSGDYSEFSATVTVSAGIGALPATFWKLLGVEMAVGGQKRTLRRFNRTERNAFSNSTYPSSALPRYKLTGPSATGVRQIEFLPAANVTGAITVRYAPIFQARNASGALTGLPLVATDDTVDFDNGWERFIVLYAAIQMLKKEESDARALESELEQCRAEIIAGAESRDADAPPSAVDMDMVDTDPLPWF